MFLVRAIFYSNPANRVACGQPIFSSSSSSYYYFRSRTFLAKPAKLAQKCALLAVSGFAKSGVLYQKTKK